MKKEELKQQLMEFLENHKDAATITVDYMSPNELVSEPLEHTEFEIENIDIDMVVDCLFDVDYGYSTINIFDENGDDLDFEPYAVATGPQKKFRISYGNGFNFETIATIEDAKREAIERHGYNAGGITIADYYSHAEISNADYWSNPYDPKIDDETPLVDYGQNGYLANWIDFE